MPHARQSPILMGPGTSAIWGKHWRVGVTLCLNIYRVKFLKLLLFTFSSHFYLWSQYGMWLLLKCHTDLTVYLELYCGMDDMDGVGRIGSLAAYGMCISCKRYT